MVIQSFKNREKELETIKGYLNSEKFEFLIIYGRRRIGKTELILEVTKNIALGQNYFTLMKNRL
jgi:AAA+ ATPase superfamily predicted ATPase